MRNKEYLTEIMAAEALFEAMTEIPHTFTPEEIKEFIAKKGELKDGKTIR